MNKIPLLISACLLGEPCRYDGRAVCDALATEEHTQEEVLTALRERYTLLPVCPEVFGGLPTPRLPAERSGERVIREDGADVTEAFARGAEVALHICERYGCRLALLKARSPSCGVGQVYDGSFRGILTDGDGVCAARLTAHGVRVVTEEACETLFHKKT